MTSRTTRLMTKFAMPIPAKKKQKNKWCWYLQCSNMEQFIWTWVYCTYFGHAIHEDSEDPKEYYNAKEVVFTFLKYIWTKTKSPSQLAWGYWVTVTSSLLPDNENSLLDKFHDLIEMHFCQKRVVVLSKDERFNSHKNIFYLV